MASTAIPGFSDEFRSRYRIEGLLGEGGMGTVFRAVHLGLDRPIAIKVLKNLHPEFVERFRREGRTLAALRHPNLVEVYDAGIDGRIPYLCTELIEGRTLEDAMLQDAWTLGRSLGVVLELARALSHAHAAGVIHRDVKPENAFLLADDAVKLSDFGLARSDSDQTLTQAGVIMGTPAYMAPEQVQGGTVGPPADQYALGVLLYRLLSGRVPFEGKDPLSQATARLRATPPLLALANPDLPPDVCEIGHRMLAREPGDRFPSVHDVEQVLGAILESLPPDALERPAAWSAKARPAADGETLAPSPTPPAKAKASVTRSGRTGSSRRPGAASSTSGRIAPETMAGAPVRSPGRVATVAGVAGVALLVAGIAATLGFFMSKDPAAVPSPGSPGSSPFPDARPVVGGVDPQNLARDIARMQENLDQEANGPQLRATTRLDHSNHLVSLMRMSTVEGRPREIPIQLITLSRDVINEIFEDQRHADLKTLSPAQAQEGLGRIRAEAAGIPGEEREDAPDTRILLRDFIKLHLMTEQIFEKMEHGWRARWAHAERLEALGRNLVESRKLSMDDPHHIVEICLVYWDAGHHAWLAREASQPATFILLGKEPPPPSEVDKIRRRSPSVQVASVTALHEIAGPLLALAPSLSRHRRNECMYKLLDALEQLGALRESFPDDPRFEACDGVQVERFAQMAWSMIDAAYFEEPRRAEKISAAIRKFHLEKPGGDPSKR